MFTLEVVILYEVIYYEDEKESPVEDFILEQLPKEQAKIIRSIDLLEEFGLSLGMPHIRKIVNYELWELRIQLGNNIFRVLFKDLNNNEFVLLHGFQKKTDKLPQKEINIALRRLEKYLER